MEETFGTGARHSAANEQQQQLQALRSLADQLERSRMQALQQVQEGHSALQTAVGRAAELERANREGVAAMATRDREAQMALSAVQVHFLHNSFVSFWA